MNNDDLNYYDRAWIDGILNRLKSLDDIIDSCERFIATSKEQSLYVDDILEMSLRERLYLNCVMRVMDGDK